MKLTTFISRSLVASLAAIPIVAASGGASAAASGAAAAIPSALVIAKSSNRNEVHYAVRVDESCAPAGPSPVLPYWKMIERGPDVTEPLTAGEQGVLGLERQERTASGVQIAVRALPGRILHIRTWRAVDGQCASEVDAVVAGVTARLGTVYVKQKLFGISYILLTGVAADGAVVQERVLP